MASQAIENYREEAEIYKSEALCKKKAMEFMEELFLPKGLLLPLDDLMEVGYNRAAGFVWFKQKNKKKEYFFCSIGCTVSYAPEVTAFIENRRIKKLTGVTIKKFLICVSLSEIYIDDPSSGEVTFKIPSGFSVSLPVSAFDKEERRKEKKEKEEYN
ncbi:Protein of unknown function DUF538 [Macleaya cordata]|uniref:DUF538 domain-containing protein n=1 Tax=Macleaya cordata TaxID=56857 RepID=A0A200PNV6_MACCD|nr:Protein of unknown function DUF538 [Macleaya cordata]